MKLLHVITGLNAGGAETALCRLLESSRERACRQVVVAIGPEGALSGRVRASGAALVHMNVAPTRPNPLSLTRLRTIVREERPDLVQAWMYHANIVAALTVLRCGASLLWSVRHSLHDLAAEKLMTRTAIRLGARMSRLPHVITYNSEESARQHEAIGYCMNRTRVIPNGFDTQVFKPAPEARARIRAELRIAPDAFVVGQVARWHPTKDHETLLQAAALYLRAHPNTVFVLVGSGVDAGNDRLDTIVRRLGITSNVRLCGHRTDIPDINAALDVASLSSRGESFPNAIGEAMACGVPCVATDVGGVREIIGSCGVVVGRRDPEAMSVGWGELARLDAAARASVGEMARRRIADHYSLDAYTAACWNLYRELITAKLRAGSGNSSAGA
ncbi:MAG: glycosyltransferase [Sciscionella sp.]